MNQKDIYKKNFEGFNQIIREGGLDTYPGIRFYGQIGPNRGRKLEPLGDALTQDMSYEDLANEGIDITDSM